ncbi:MAG: carbohydrate-binding protein [Planctomycetes bacterium]|nr:carbohydrate-binding protein [Planctomycetota bacterium]
MTRAARTVLAVGAVVLSGWLATSVAAEEKTLVIPAVSLSAQGGGEDATVTKARQPSERFAAGYVHFWYTPGHWLQWTIDAPAAGQYDVTLQYTAKLGTSRSLSVNGQAVRGLDPFMLPRTNRWSAWNEIKLPARVALNEGANTIRITCLDDASMWLNEIVFSRADAPPITVKAARFAGQGGGRVQILTPITLGYVNEEQNRRPEKGAEPEQHWIEWIVADAAAGEYEMHLHYAADNVCTRRVQVNGEVVEGLESVVLPSTADDTNWTETRLPATVRLKQGRNVLRLTNVDGERFRLSAIRLVSPPSKPIETPVVDEVAVADDLAMLQPNPDLPPASLGPPMPNFHPGIALKEGEEDTVDGMRAKVTTIDALPYVKNDFSQRYHFENYDNPKLRYLREKYHLDDVVAAGKTEFEKQALLMKWVYEQWDFGYPREMIPEHGALGILKHSRREHKFYCAHSAAILMAAANSMGWVCRNMAIPRHSFSEIWSNEHKKWVTLDATSNYYPERDGVPLNTYEFRQALLVDHAERLLHVRPTDTGLDKKPQDEKYGQRLLFIGYIPNTNYMDRGPDYEKFFITKDELTTGKWHTRDCPPNPAVDPYFPINQAAVTLTSDANGMEVTLGTMTPNFKEFRVRQDGGPWRTADGTTFIWKLHEGTNRLEAVSRNKFDVDGPVSTVVIEASK